MDKMNWAPPGAETKDELMNVLFFAAAGLKSQVVDSPILNSPELVKLKQRISEIANELHGLQQDVV